MNTSGLNGALLVVGRILISIIFLTSGYGKITGFSGTAAFMESKGMPLASLLLVGAIAVELLGGLSLLLGIKARWGALALFLFLIPTTLIFHAFWGLADAQEAHQQYLAFMKNLTIMGGLLAVAAAGAPQPGLDRLFKGCGCGCNAETPEAK